MRSEQEKPSKSAIKRELEPLQELALALIRLSPAELQKLELDGRLHDTILSARTIRKHGARRRQQRRVAKLLREVDTETLGAALATLHRPAREAVRIEHEAERWRERLLAEGHHALGDLLRAFPGADRPHFHRLVRGALAAGDDDPAPKRALFRALRDLLGGA